MRKVKVSANLVCVGEPIWKVASNTYSINSNIHIQGWESIKRQGFLIGYPRSNSHIERRYISQIDKTS